MKGYQMSDWAVILGASSGIGAACAKELARKGMNIFGVYLRKPKDHIQKMKHELEKYGIDVIFKKMSASNEDKRLAKTGLSRAKSNKDFIKDLPLLGLSNGIASDETKEIDIEIDFLDGDTLIIDKSLEIANFEFDSLETSIEDIILDLQIEDNSDLSFNIIGNEMFKNFSSSQSSDQTNLEELLISLSSTENLNQEKRFIF